MPGGEATRSAADVFLLTPAMIYEVFYLTIITSSVLAPKNVCLVFFVDAFLVACLFVCLCVCLFVVWFVGWLAGLAGMSALRTSRTAPIFYLDNVSATVSA